MLALDRSRPRVLVVTPEISALPPGMGNRAETVAAKAGGTAAVSAGLVGAVPSMYKNRYETRRRRGVG